MAEVCRVCGAVLGEADYAEDAPSISSMATILNLPLSVYVCRTCAHAQSSELPDLENYYDKKYRISMTSADHDQLYGVEDGVEIFRTDKQAELVLTKVNLPNGARLLDFGAAKAATLRKICSKRQDLVPHVFDVSNDYVGHWAGWLEKDQFATYTLPESWDDRFDAITAHFVLEHVANPVGMLADLRRVMKLGGVLFLSAPNTLSNPGDMLVADHINHFSRPSLHRVLQRTGFRILNVDDAAFRGAFVVTAEAVEESEDEESREHSEKQVAISELVDQARSWSRLSGNLQDRAREYTGRPSAIYGAGFYGTFLFSQVSKLAEVRCFVDRNPYIANTSHLDLPVFAPEALPGDVEVVYAGLNPSVARGILGNVEEWKGRDIQVVYMDEV